MAYMAYYLLNHKTVYHSSSYIWQKRHTTLRKRSRIKELDKVEHVCWLLLRHIQDGALQVTKEAIVTF